MNVRNDVKVVINNKEYTLCGYESGEYLQKIASYINAKWDELRVQEGYNNLDNDMKNLFLALNLTDDYYKMKQQWEELEAADEDKDKEIFEMKHEMIALQTKLESVEAKLKESKERYNHLQKENIRLEVELGHNGRMDAQKGKTDEGGKDKDTALEDTEKDRESTEEKENSSSDNRSKTHAKGRRR